jgi:hypothetical protein
MSRVAGSPPGLHKEKGLAYGRGPFLWAATDLPGRARESVAKDLPEQARGSAAAKVNEFYDELAARGGGL